MTFVFADCQHHPTYHSDSCRPASFALLLTASWQALHISVLMRFVIASCVPSSLMTRFKLLPLFLADWSVRFESLRGAYHFRSWRHLRIGCYLFSSTHAAEIPCGFSTTKTYSIWFYWVELQLIRQSHVLGLRGILISHQTLVVDQSIFVIRHCAHDFVLIVPYFLHLAGPRPIEYENLHHYHLHDSQTPPIPPNYSLIFTNLSLGCNSFFSSSAGSCLFISVPITTSCFFCMFWLWSRSRACMILFLICCLWSCGTVLLSSLLSWLDDEFTYYAIDSFFVIFFFLSSCDWLRCIDDFWFCSALATAADYFPIVILP